MKTKKEIQVIGASTKYGCPVEGADLAYKHLKNSLENILNIKCETDIEIENKRADIVSGDNIKNISQVMEFNNKLHDAVTSALENNKFPLVVGGDHSMAIGSISGVLDYYQGDVSVIYVDKHADIHNEKTTPSGNIHGMPLSICIGRCDERFDIGKHKLKPSNLYFLGLCNYEQEEMDYIKQEGIYHLKDYEINDNNIDEIISEIKKRLNTKYIHLSFDLDSIRDSDFHAVNVSVNNTYQNENGMSYNTVLKLVNKLLAEFNLCSMDIVEYNPLLDKDGNYKRKIEELLTIISK